MNYILLTSAYTFIHPHVIFSFAFYRNLRNSFKTVKLHRRETCLFCTVWFSRHQYLGLIPHFGFSFKWPRHVLTNTSTPAKFSLGLRVNRREFRRKKKPWIWFIKKERSFSFSYFGFSFERLAFHSFFLELQKFSSKCFTFKRCY